MHPSLMGPALQDLLVLSRLADACWIITLVLLALSLFGLIRSLVGSTCDVGAKASSTQRRSSRKTVDHPFSKQKKKAVNLAKTAYRPGHSLECIRLIRELNFDVNERVTPSGMTLFLCGCVGGHYKLVRFMLRRGADIRILTVDGEDAFYLATFAYLHSTDPQLELLTMLLERGCQINHQNRFGFSALHLVAAEGHIALAKYFLMWGANTNLRTSCGIFPAQLAANRGHTKVAQLLAIKTIATPSKNSPFKVAMGFMCPPKRHLQESTMTVSRLRLTASEE